MTDEQWWTVGRWAAWRAQLASFAAEALDWKRTAGPQGLAVDLLLHLGGY